MRHSRQRVVGDERVAMGGYRCSNSRLHPTSWRVFAQETRLRSTKSIEPIETRLKPSFASLSISRSVLLGSLSPFRISEIWYKKSLLARSAPRRVRDSTCRATTDPISGHWPEI